MNIDKFIIVLLTLIEKHSTQLRDLFIFRPSSPSSVYEWSSLVITCTRTSSHQQTASVQRTDNWDTDSWLAAGCSPSPDYLTRTKWQDQTGPPGPAPDVQEKADCREPQPGLAESQEMFTLKIIKCCPTESSQCTGLTTRRGRGPPPRAHRLLPSGARQRLKFPAV